MLAFAISAITQNVWENTNSEVHPFLFRMAQKGLIEYNDLIKPINRVHVVDALSILKLKDSLLSNIEKQELAFYLQEYNRPAKEQISLFKKDQNKRWRTGAIISNDFEVYIDPLLGINNFNGTNKNILQISNGFELWGTTGKNKNIGYQGTAGMSKEANKFYYNITRPIMTIFLKYSKDCVIFFLSS